MPVRMLPRRTFLRGAGQVAIALPVLEAMLPRTARAAGPPPRRLVLWFTANGTVPDQWTPGPNFALGPILAPLAAHKPRILALSGLAMHSSGGDKKGHNRGVGTLWTGREPYGGNDGDTSYAAGISVDQHIVQALAPPTKFASLELGVEVKSSQPRGRMIYAGPGQALPPEDSPTKLFTRLFSDLGQGQDQLAALRARRRTVLDAVMGEITSLQPRLGAADKQKLDAHLTAVRGIEERLDNLQELPPACMPPNAPAPLDVKKNDNFPALGQLQMDLLVMALACDLTRVASLMWSHALSGAVHTWLGHTSDHHGFSHFGDPASVEKLIQINTWYAERLAEFLTRLQQIDEGGTTLLDNTLVCWGSELGKGQPHYCKDIPFVLSDGGQFKGGRHLSLPGRSHNDLLISLMHAMGVPDPTFGDPAHCTGPVGELLG